MSDPIVKKCTLCCQEKPLEAFNKHRSCKLGRDSRCRACNKKGHVKKSPERFLEHFHERFDARLDKSGAPHPKLGTPCWVWTGARFRKGYGSVGVRYARNYRKVERAHCVAYRRWHGELPNGMQVLHKCDNPPCCNPEHLYAGTHAQNMEDRDRQHHAAKKLNPGLVREIRTLHGTATATAIGRRFGVTDGTIVKIWDRRIWRHVD